MFGNRVGKNSFVSDFRVNRREIKGERTISSMRILFSRSEEVSKST